VNGVFFPLDEQLELSRHSWSRETIKQAVQEGVEIASYERGAKRFSELTKVPMSKSSLGRLVKEYGGQLVKQQGAEAEATVRPPAPGEEIVWREIPEPDSETMALCLDGALINIREEGWKEVKIATISAVEVAVSDQGEPEVGLSRHSYRAGLWEAKEFAKQQWAEGCRRGLEKAEQIVSINDGALWIWLIIQMCWAPCVEILDWWHAVERLWEVAHQLLAEDEQTPAAWMKQQKTALWDSRLRDVFGAIRLLCPRGKPLPEPVRQVVGYLFHNRRRVRYKEYRQAGLPIGSGSVESACKVVVQARMKQAGMRWSRDGAQAMLALRCALLSDRFDELWPSLFLDPKPT
jgi:hypothetical protein